MIAPQLAPERDDGGIVGGTFDAAIGAGIVVAAVTVVLAVRLVVLIGVAHQVGEGETIMHGDMVDAAARTATVVIEQVGRAGHSAADLADQTSLTGPITPQRLTVAIVPFGPSGRKRADLIAARADVPRFGDQLRFGEHRILPDRGEERRTAIKAVRTARKRGRKIEAEAVDVADLDPIAQRVHDKLENTRMGEVERVAAAGEVIVIARLVRQKPIVGRVIDTAEAQCRPEMIAFRRMVVNHIENDLDACIVQARHRRAKRVQRIVRRITRLRRKKTDRVVAPVVAQAAKHQIAVVNEGMDRKKLDGGHTKPLEMIDDGRCPECAERSA